VTLIGNFIGILGAAILFSARAEEPRFLEPAPKDVDQYSELWTEPLFARPTANNVLVEPPGEPPVELVLTGWGEIQGEWVASIYERKSGMHHFLRTGEPSQTSDLELVELQPSAIATKALIQVQGRFLWIAADEEPELAEAGVQEASEVDSRAARLTGAELLTADATTAERLVEGDAARARIADRLHQKTLLERHRRLSLRFPDTFQNLAGSLGRLSD